MEGFTPEVVAARADDPRAADPGSGPTLRRLRRRAPPPRAPARTCRVGATSPSTWCCASTRSADASAAPASGSTNPGVLTTRRDFKAQALPPYPIDGYGTPLETRDMSAAVCGLPDLCARGRDPLRGREPGARADHHRGQSDASLARPGPHETGALVSGAARRSGAPSHGHGAARALRARSEAAPRSSGELALHGSALHGVAGAGLHGALRTVRTLRRRNHRRVRTSSKTGSSSTG